MNASTPIPEKAPFDYKQVIVIRTDLGMSKGKMVAQGSHVAVNASDLVRTNDWQSWHAWKVEGHAKIVCKVDSLDELLAVKRDAGKAGIPCVEIADLGRTELELGTITAIAVGPALVKDVNTVTRRLKLLS